MVIKVCEICVVLYVGRLMELEHIIPAWEELETIELLLAIGENLTEENGLHMDLARTML